MNIIPSGRAPDCTVQKYLGSAYDVVKEVAENLEEIKTVNGAIDEINAIIPEIDTIKDIGQHIDIIKQAPTYAENAANSAEEAKQYANKAEETVQGINTVYDQVKQTQNEINSKAEEVESIKQDVTNIATTVQEERIKAETAANNSQEIYDDWSENWMGSFDYFPEPTKVNGVLMYYLGNQAPQGLYISKESNSDPVTKTWEIVAGRGETGEAGSQGPQGEQGPIGQMPDHRWEGTSIQFQNSPDSWGPLVDIQGERGAQGPIGPQGIPGNPGNSFKIDAIGFYSELHNYDSEPEGFVFFAKDYVWDTSFNEKSIIGYKSQSSYTVPFSVKEGDKLFVFIGGQYQDTNTYTLEDNRVTFKNGNPPERATITFRTMYSGSTTGALFLKLGGAGINWSDPYIFGVGPQGPVGPVGPQGEIGPKGDVGPIGPRGFAPEHEWDNTRLRFKNPDGSWGDYVNLIGNTGPQGERGPVGFTGPQGERGPKGDRGEQGKSLECVFKEWNLSTSITYSTLSNQSTIITPDTPIMLHDDSLGTSKPLPPIVTINTGTTYPRYIDSNMGSIYLSFATTAQTNKNININTSGASIVINLKGMPYSQSPNSTLSQEIEIPLNSVQLSESVNKQYKEIKLFEFSDLFMEIPSGWYGDILPIITIKGITISTSDSTGFNFNWKYELKGPFPTKNTKMIKVVSYPSAVNIS